MSSLCDILPSGFCSAAGSFRYALLEGKQLWRFDVPFVRAECCFRHRKSAPTDKQIDVKNLWIFYHTKFQIQSDE
jgi:hypothetical protein